MTEAPTPRSWWVLAHDPKSTAVVTEVYDEDGVTRVAFRRYGGSTGRRNGTEWSLPVWVFLETWQPNPITPTT